MGTSTYILTIIRRIFNNVMFTVGRSGSAVVNGRYVYDHLDSETHMPVFIQEPPVDSDIDLTEWRSECARILPLDYDVSDGFFGVLWCIK